MRPALLPAVGRCTGAVCSVLCETAWDAVLAAVLLVAGLVVFCQHAFQASASFRAINGAISSDEHDFDYFWTNTRLCAGLACGFGAASLLGLGYMAGLFRGPWRADQEPCAGFRVPRARGGKRGGAVAAVLLTLAGLLWATLLLGACALGAGFAQTLAVGSERVTEVLASSAVSPARCVDRFQCHKQLYWAGIGVVVGLADAGCVACSLAQSLW